MGRIVLARIGDVALWIGAIVGACCLVVLLASLLFGIRPLIFRSGSMSPTITTGSLAFAHRIPAGQVRVGDIVSVPVGDTRVTHRVIKVTAADGAVSLRLRGDANPTPDAQSYRVTTVEKVWFWIPGIGYAVAWLSRPPGIFVLVLYAAVLLGLILRRPAAPPAESGT